MSDQQKALKALDGLQDEIWRSGLGVPEPAIVQEHIDGIRALIVEPVLWVRTVDHCAYHRPCAADGTIPPSAFAPAPLREWIEIGKLWGIEVREWQPDQPATVDEREPKER